MFDVKFETPKSVQFFNCETIAIFEQDILRDEYKQMIEQEFGDVIAPDYRVVSFNHKDGNSCVELGALFIPKINNGSLDAYVFPLNSSDKLFVNGEKVSK